MPEIMKFIIARQIECPFENEEGHGPKCDKTHFIPIAEMVDLDEFEAVVRGMSEEDGEHEFHIFQHVGSKKFEIKTTVKEIEKVTVQ